MTRKARNTHKVNNESVVQKQLIDTVHNTVNGSTTYLVHEGRVLAEINKAPHGLVYHCNGRRYLSLESAINHEMARLLAVMFDNVYISTN